MKRSYKILLLVFGLALWTTSCGSGSNTSSNANGTMFGTSGQTAPVVGNLQQGIQALQQVGIVFVLVQDGSGLAPVINQSTFMSSYPGLNSASWAVQEFMSLAGSYLQQLQYSGQTNTTTYVYTATEYYICQQILNGAVG
jgi:hypothetical protein